MAAEACACLSAPMCVAGVYFKQEPSFLPSQVINLSLYERMGGGKGAIFKSPLSVGNRPLWRRAIPMQSAERAVYLASRGVHHL